MAQKKKDSKMMGKIIKTAVSGVLCVALAGGMVAANVLIPPNASSVQSILGLKSGGIDNSKAKTEGINMEYSKPGFDTEAALVEDEIALNKKIAAEGIVLLKNDAGKMPYSTDTTFSFVSHSAVSYIGGNKVDMKTAFEDAGFGVNEDLWKFYSEGNGKDYGLGVGSVSYGDDEDFSINECPLSVMQAEPGLTDSMQGTVPVFVFSRVAGEGRDMPRSMYNHTDVEEDKTKTYLEPDSVELEILQYLNDNFDDVVLLLNSSAAVDLSWVEDYPSIHTVISAPAMGDYGLCSLAEIFSGKVNPSGRTVDTYEVDAMNSPAAQNFGDFAYYDENGNLTKYNYVSYKEGIYVGYRYYETRYEDKVLGQGNAGDYNYDDAVMYPFGYGLSYTTFDWSDYNTSWDGDTCTVTVKVTNTGSVAGKDVVEVYAQSPYTDYDKTNKVEKAAVELVGYAKTSELAPGASETVTVTFDQEQLKSYDYTNAKTYILDAGDYYFTIGNGAHEAVQNVLAAEGQDVGGDADKAKSWNLGSQDTTTFATTKNGTAVENQLADMDVNYWLPGTATYLTRADWEGTFPKTYKDLTATDEMIDILDNDIYEINANGDPSTVTFGADNGLTLADLKGVSDINDERWDMLMDEITLEECMIRTGFGGTSTKVIESIMSPETIQNDGPNGIYSYPLGQYANTDASTGDPCVVDANDPNLTYKMGTMVNETVIAQTFNKDLAADYGRVIGNYSLWANTTIFWGIGTNLHRLPYNARNHEYYSEDAVLTAGQGTAYAAAAMEYGVIIAPKHLAFNDTEINRTGVSVFMTEQQARENELRGTQAAIEDAGALGVMTAFNRVGITAANAHTGLLKNILRGEWGFKGLESQDFIMNPNYAVLKEYALNGGTMTTFTGENTMAAVSEKFAYWTTENVGQDTELMSAIKQAMTWQAYALANSNALDGMASSTRLVSVRTWYDNALVAVQVVFAALTVLAAAMYVLNDRKSKKQ